MKKSRAFLTVLTAVWLAGAVSTTSFGEVLFYNSSAMGDSDEDEDKDSDKETDESAFTTVKKLLEAGKMTAEEIKKLGPAYEAALDAYDSWALNNNQLGSSGRLGEEADSDFDGPVVTKVTLGQTYHKDYETYEFSIADEYFFYANVGNGDLTDQSVTIDIPTNLTYTVEKDGLPYAYQSKQSISAKGTYVVKLMAVENQEAPLSEQKEYQAVLRFRIQDKPVTKDASSEKTGFSSSALGWDADEEQELTDADWEDLEAEQEDETQEAQEIQVTEENGEEDQNPEDVIAVQPLEFSARSQRFDSASGNYIITLKNGKELTASVPEGYLGSGSVFLHVSEEDAEQTMLYQNNQLIEFINDSTLTEAGSYRVELNGESCFFTLADALARIDYYPAPAGMKFIEAYCNEEELPLSSERYAVLQEDGFYTFILSGEAGERLEVRLKKDTTPPEMNVEVSKSSVSIQYLSDDIETIQLIRNGDEVADFRGTTITEPGKYRLTIFDAAGNWRTKSFVLNYHVNLYGVFAILLVILTIAGIGFFAVYIKKHTKVR